MGQKMNMNLRKPFGDMKDNNIEGTSIIGVQSILMINLMSKMELEPHVISMRVVVACFT